MSDLNRENGRDLTTNESTKSQLGARIPRRRPQIAMRRGLESSPVSGRERNKEWNCFGERERERERHGLVLKTGDTSLTGLF
jgi:hypothetical protein